MASPARADWLVLLPECSLAPLSEPRFEVLYPRDGLPSVIAPGANLVARVRVPVALTPPPGAQQPAVLRPWAARLMARAEPLFGASGDSLVYPLPVLDMRPDGASGLVYRLTLPVPAWTAPGAYDLWLRGPGGQMTRSRSVFVRRADEGESRIVRWPIDPAKVAYALVKYGDGFWEFGSDPACARMAQAERRGLVNDAQLHNGVQALPDAPVVPHGSSARERLRILSAGSTFRVRLAAGSRGDSARLIVPVRSGGYRVTGARDYGFFPIGEWHGVAPGRLALWAGLVRGRDLVVSPRAASSRVPSSRSAPSPEPLTVAVQPGFPFMLPLRADPGERLAMRLGAERTHFGSEPVLGRVPEAGPRLLTVLAIDSRGGVTPRRVRLAAAPARGGRSGSCAVALRPASAGWPGSGAISFCLLLFARALRRYSEPVALQGDNVGTCVPFEKRVWSGNTGGTRCS